MLCYFCAQEIKATDTLNMHHPDKANHPDWIEPAHAECHVSYHKSNGHFAEWGSWSPFAGRDGYLRALRKYPGWHSMGGKMRARTAKRRPNGTFLPNGG